MADTVLQVSLLTKHARRALASLREARVKTRTKASSRIKGATMQRAKQLFGAAAGAGAVSRVTRRLRGGSAQVDPWEGALIPIIATFEHLRDRAQGFNVAARRAARADVAQTLNQNLAHGASYADAKVFFNIRDKIRQDQMKGLNIVRRQVTGPTLDELMLAAAKGYFSLSGRAWTYVWNSLGIG